MNAQRVVSVVSVKKPGKLQLFLKKIVSGGYGSSVALIALFIVSSLVSPYFLTQINIFNLLRQICVYGFMSLGLTLVILSGNIDLSIGGVMTLCSLTAAVMSVKGYHPFLIILISLLVGGIFGLVNGLIVAKFRVESFVVTIGTQFIAFGLGYSLSGGKTILADLDPAIAYLSDGFIGPVPFPVILLGVTYAIFAFIISNTAFGHYIHALGGNEKAA
jgi:ribose/xylose/arabinose/galactoside ABC-type transport system permease subunit